MITSKLYQKALNTFGWSHQFVVACEELSELQKELCKYIRGKGDFDHITEELADALICIGQVMEFLDCWKEVFEWKAKKLVRLKGEIEKEELR